MGNRAYFTIETKTESKTFYTHWNGGLDTFAPLSKALFESNVKTVDEVIQFLKLALEMKPDLETSSEVSSFLEENGHYFLDLEDKRLYHVLASGMRMTYLDLESSFNEFVNTRILEDHRTRVRTQYWDGIQNAASKYFGGAK